MLNKLRDKIYDDACEHGLWREEDTLLDGAQMIRAECMELIQEAAKGSVTDALCEELADVIIMCLSFAGRYAINIARWVGRKMIKNRMRPWRHEEKKEGNIAKGQETGQRSR